MIQRLHRPGLVAVLLVGLGAACAASPDEDAATGPVDPETTARASIEQYLEVTQPLDPTNTLEADRLAKRGDRLVPALLELFAEDRSPGDVYHLIRLGCTMVRDGRVDPSQARAIRDAADAAASRLRSDSREAWRSTLELDRCEPPAPEPEDEGEGEGEA